MTNEKERMKREKITEIMGGERNYGLIKIYIYIYIYFFFYNCATVQFYL